MFMNVSVSANHCFLCSVLFLTHWLHFGHLHLFVLFSCIFFMSPSPSITLSFLAPFYSRFSCNPVFPIFCFFTCFSPHPSSLPPALHGCFCCLIFHYLFPLNRSFFSPLFLKILSFWGETPSLFSFIDSLIFIRLLFSSLKSLFSFYFQIRIKKKKKQSFYLLYSSISILSFLICFQILRICLFHFYTICQMFFSVTVLDSLQKCDHNNYHKIMRSRFLLRHIHGKFWVSILCYILIPFPF